MKGDERKKGEGMKIEKAGLNDIFRGIRKVDVIEILCARGAGTKDDIARYVRKYYEQRDDGKLEYLFTKDSLDEASD